MDTTSIRLAALLAVIVGSAAPPAARADNTEKPYKIENGAVDKATFNGYRRYSDACLRCHGPDGAGSSYAPALTDSLKQLTKEQFTDVVINGRVNVSAASDKVMPAFGTVEDVVLYLHDIYAYLKARSDGVVGRGRPKRIGSDD